MSETKKDWERPWSTEEILEHADNWNLACDSALLHTLKDFGDRILNKAEEVNNKIVNICDNLEDISLQVDLARNEFNSLRNSQFMECRVYEEDETLLIEAQGTEKEENAVPKTETMEDIREAVEKGLDVLDKFYERVEVTVSDSEDEEELPSYVYRRKDPYINRPLPFVIGSEQWYKKWHVGLEESSDSEDEKSPSDKYSDSDSESNSEVKDRSDASSELSNLSSSNNLKRKSAAVSTANTTLNNDFLASSINKNSTTASTPIASSFAEQLAAKLGNVIKENEQLLGDSEVNKRPIQKNPISDFGALFSNEPPPLEDVPSKEKDVHGIFSGGKGLFDDDDEEDDSLWNPSKLPSKSPTEQNKTNNIKSPKVQSLFDDESDDDIFVSAQRSVAVNQTKQTYLQSNKPPTVPIFADEPPILEEEKPKVDQKKPKGGVSIFGNTDIFQNQNLGSILKQRRKSSSDDSEENSATSRLIENDEQVIEKPPSLPINTEQSPVKQEAKKVPTQSIISKVPTVREPNHKKLPEKNKTNLFDDNDDLFSNEIPSMRKGGGLFDDDIFEDDLFSNVSNKLASKSNKGILFSEEDEFEEPQPITEPANKNENIHPKNKETSKENIETVPDIENEYDYSWRKSSKSKIDSLFDDLEDDDFDIFKPKTTKPDAKISNKSAENNNDKSEEVEEKNQEKLNVTEPKLGLFDDDFDDVDDLFSEIMKKAPLKKTQADTERNKLGEEKTEVNRAEKETSPVIKLENTNEKLDGSKRKVIETDENGKNNKNMENEREPSTSASHKSKDLILTVGDSEPLLRQQSSTLNEGRSIETRDNDESNPVEDEKVVSEDRLEETLEHIQVEPTTGFVQSSSQNYSRAVESSSKSEHEEHHRLSIPHVNFVDTLPPPDDDWENSSDNAIDDFEPYVNDGYQSQPSSLFDNEPPSLFFNETSGVVEDNSYNRFDSVNSFDPSLTSSRRLSSDIFNDFQKNDSLFLTKSLDGSNLGINSTLQSVLETTDIFSDDNTNITPSGNPDDLYYSVSTDASKSNRISDEIKNDEVQSTDILSKEEIMTSSNNQQSRLSMNFGTNNSPTESSSIIDKPDKDETDDLVSVKINERKEWKANENIIIDNGGGEILIPPDDKNADKDKISSENIQDSDEMQSNVSRITEQLQELSTKNEKVKNKTIPGKLNLNLNINVGALIPGSAPPRKEKIQDVEENAHTMDTKDELLVSKRVAPFLRTVSESDTLKKEYKLEKSISFDNAADVEILQSVTKNRVRIPVKRKPSSRRARQQSLRNSVPDFKLLDPDELEESQEIKRNKSEVNSESKKHEQEQSISVSTLKKSVSLFSDEDETEDLFKTLQKSPEIMCTKKENISIERESIDKKGENKELYGRKSTDLFEKKIEKIFSDVEYVPDLITKSDSILERTVSDKKTTVGFLEDVAETSTGSNSEKVQQNMYENLFESTDDSDDFPNVNKKKSTKEVDTTKKTTTTSKSLFDSSDEDDDFFKTIGSKKVPKEENEPSKAPTHVKTKSIALFDDDEDNEDLFSDAVKPSAVTKQNTQTSVINKKTPKTSFLRKLEKSEGDEDPLSALLN